MSLALGKSGRAQYSMPLEAVTSTLAILAKKGAGKSNAAVVMAEAMWAAKVPFVVVDPKGDWWGIRSDSNGTRPGLDVVVFGGRHGDVPLEPTAGNLIAELIVEHALTCVLDVSQFTAGEVRRFLIDFATRLFRLAEDTPMHLFLEEAHEYLPQQVRGDQAQLVGAFQRIVKQGRFKGIGVTMISQRSAALNKDVLTQADVLIVLRTTSPQDRAAVKAWLNEHSESQEALSELPGLRDGEAWVWWPGSADELVKLQFRRRWTFDSGATPKVGEKRREPSTLADVDLAAIKEAMADTIEKAKADDPRELRKRIAELERESALRLDMIDRTPRVETRIVNSVAWFPEDVWEQIKSHAAALANGIAHLDGIIDEQLASTTETTITFTDTDAGVALDVAPPRPESQPLPSNVRLLDEAMHGSMARSQRRSLRDAGFDPDVRNLGRAEQRILAALAQYPQGRSQSQIALLTGYRPTASTIGVALSKLRKAGYVTAGGSPVQATPEGIAALGDNYEPLPQGQALLAYWRSTVGKAERMVLDLMVAEPDREWSQLDIAVETSYSPQASTIGVALSKLRKLELVEGWHLHPDFREAIR